MPDHHLIFDLDGKISDPSVGILRSINYALSSFGHQPVAETAISAYIGPPIDLTFRSHTNTTSEEHILALVAKFRERYADVGISKTAQLSQLQGDGPAGPASTMIGDRAIDIAAGKANLLRSVGVLWGHGSESELVDAGADRVLSSPFELAALADSA